jgi:anti-sigma B factor antagonist
LNRASERWEWAYSKKFDWRNVSRGCPGWFDKPRFSESFSALRCLISGSEFSRVVGVYRDDGGSHRHQKRRTNMGLKITGREVNGVAVLALEGRIVLGEETVTFREKVKGLLAAGEKKLVLDLKGVTLIDSSGLGALVAAHSSAHSSGATLGLCNLGSRTNELLQITRLVTVFEVFNSEADAVLAMSKAASAAH